MESSTGSPVTYPQVTIGGETYTVKFSMLAQFVLDEAGVDTRELATQMKRPGAGKVALFLKLFAAGVAHQFLEAQLPIPTATEWAARIGEDPGAKIFGAICGAVVAAMGKAQSPAEAASPAQQTTAASNPVN